MKTNKILENWWNKCRNYSELDQLFDSFLEALTSEEKQNLLDEINSRSKQLYNDHFSIAALLFTEGEAGNDGFLDFLDCACFLPAKKFEEISNSYDNLMPPPQNLWVKRV